MTQQPVIAEALTVRPGDTLVVRPSAQTSVEACEQLAQDLKEKLPGVDLLFLGGYEQIAVYRGDT